MNESISPDDVEDVILFVERVEKSIRADQITKLISHWTRLAYAHVNSYDRLEDGNCIEALTTMHLLEFFVFLKKNQYAISELLKIGDEGAPFLDQD